VALDAAQLAQDLVDVVAEDEGGEEVALRRRADFDARVDEVSHRAPARRKGGVSRAASGRGSHEPNRSALASYVPDADHIAHPDHDGGLEAKDVRMKADMLRRDEHTAMQKYPPLHSTAEVFDQNLMSRQAEGGLKQLRRRRLPVQR
jgi:hypothetical protein